MKLHLTENKFIDTNEPLDLSIPVKSIDKSVRAWYLNKPQITPVRSNEFLGSVEEGGSVNFRNIFFNPHGHGTHTECCGHITSKVYSINQSVKHFFVKCLLISVCPEKIWNESYQTFDSVITLNQLKELIPENPNTEAIIIRTIPNSIDKLSMNYSDSNPAYFEDDVVNLLDEFNMLHFLTDLPSVDRELDNGKLAFHHRYWNVPNEPKMNRTITELVFVDDTISDGIYLLDLQIAPIENDASPSRPVLYEIKTVTN